MTTYIYGGSPADVVTDTDGNVLAGVELEVYATASSLTPVAGLAQKTGDTYKPVYRLKTDDEGRYQFTSNTGPTLWIETASSGKRWRVEAWQTTTEKLADLLNATATASTLPPGHNATAQITATDNSMSFTFGIPKGAKGDKGDKGEPGGSESVVAEYFHSATSLPMQALSELGVPRPYPSKTAIDATRGSTVGELARDTSSRVTYVWNGTRWIVWDRPTVRKTPVSWGPNIDTRFTHCHDTIRNGWVYFWGRAQSTKTWTNWMFGKFDDMDMLPSQSYELVVPMSAWCGGIANAYVNAKDGQMNMLAVREAGGVYFSGSWPLNVFN